MTASPYDRAGWYSGERRRPADLPESLYRPRKRMHEAKRLRSPEEPLRIRVYLDRPEGGA